MWQKRKMRCGATVPVYIRTYNISVHISSISKREEVVFILKLTMEWDDGEEVKMCACSFLLLKTYNRGWPMCYVLCLVVYCEILRWGRC